MKAQVYEEWQKEAKQRFGETPLNWKFICPKCERTHTVQDFKDREVDPDRAPQECLGRHDDSIGCNWVAYGLFGTMGKGREVEMPDGRKVEVFDFAPGGESA